MSGRPRVLANFALSADGKVTTRSDEPSTFTSSADKKRLLEIRARGDAVMVGARTVAADTMRMTLPDSSLQDARREKGMSAQPLRVLLSTSGDLDPQWKVFRSRGARRLVFSTERMPAPRRKIFERLADLHILSGSTLPLAEVLTILRREYQVRTVVCEGGPTLLRSLAEADLLDTLHITMAPVIFGGAEAPTLLGRNPDFLRHIRRLKLEAMEARSDELFLRYRVNRSAS